MLRKPKPKGDTEQAKPRKAAGVTRSTSTTETEERSQTKQQLNLSVPGEPIGQPRHRVSTIGGQARMYLPTKHPVKAFKAAIQAAFVAEAKRWRTIQGPVLVNINVWFGIPASWSRKKRTSYCGLYHAQKPDADNVVKAVLDALTDCEVWVDDSQVAICQVTKRWAGSEPQTLIEIVEL